MKKTVKSISGSKHIALTEEQKKALKAVSIKGNKNLIIGSVKDYKKEDIVIPKTYSIAFEKEQKNPFCCKESRYSDLKETIEVKRKEFSTRAISSEHRDVFEIGKINDSCFEIRVYKEIADMIFENSKTISNAELFHREHWSCSYFARFKTFETMLKALQEFINIYSENIDGVKISVANTKQKEIAATA